MLIIQGDIDEIRFRNEDNGYTVLVLDYSGDPVVCAGNFPPVKEGQYLKLKGDFVVHPKFGKQFKVESATPSVPSTIDGIVRYLGSGLIKGVGPKTAYHIVDAFGERTFDVIERNPSRLSEIKGITKAKAAEIAEEYQKIKQMQNVMVFLQGNNLTLNLSLKIYKQYGESTVSQVQSNPYRLIEDIDGVGFITADKIASNMGIVRDSEFRIRAGIIYTLKDSSEKNGNTYLPIDELTKEASRLLALDSELVSAHIYALMMERKLNIFKIDDVEAVMLTFIYRAEKNTAVNLLKLVSEADKVNRDCKSVIAEFERSQNIKFHSQQIDAIECAINNGVSVITGGPGTGKTTIIKCILYILDILRQKYALMAPTGRAAKRLNESTGAEASTIHRAFMLGRDGNGNRDGEKLNANVVIIDEVSMMDIFLINTMLSRLAPATRLVFVGDSDQLPSVGAGNVLKDIMDSGLVPTVRLTEIYRQGKESLITLNAHAINRGEMPELGRTDADFFYTRCKAPEEVAETTVGLACDRIPKYLGIEQNRVQVLCPLKNGVAGAINLNKLLQEKINKHGGYIEGEEYLFRIRDKVMHITNNYNLAWQRMTGRGEIGEGVFNGDMGIINELRLDSGEIDVLFEDGRLATYTPDIRNQLLPAYAITIHKSQGSEFDAVIMPIVGSSPVIMTRNLLYTAITRAKKLVVLVGDDYHIRRMVDNNYIAKRYSALSKFLKDGSNDMSFLYGTGGADE